ncbi:hypothetical protein PENSPDRAFT_694654 [Peniophora sp. CONT]|nr:hypothetical protein PENSPDRAFT_694654 [Peniophora sp. CONT]
MPFPSHMHDYCQPTDVDRWLQANEAAWPRIDSRVLTTDVLRDIVDVRVEMISQRARHPLDPRDPFEITPPFIALVVTIHFPDHCGLPPRLWNSPRAILECWEGVRSSTDAPHWANDMDFGEVRRYTQPRCIVSDFFASLAMSHANISEGYSPAMLRWASEVTVVRQARRVVMQSPINVERQSLALRRTPRLVESAFEGRGSRASRVRMFHQWRRLTI